MFGLIGIGINVILLLAVFSLIGKLDDIARRLTDLEDRLFPRAAPAEQREDGVTPP